MAAKIPTPAQVKKQLDDTLTKANSDSADRDAFYGLISDAAEIWTAFTYARRGTAKRAEAVKTLHFLVEKNGDWDNQWRAEMVFHLATGFGCEAFTNGNVYNGEQREVVIIGSESAVTFLTKALPVIAGQADPMVREYTKEHMKIVGPETDADKRNGVRRDYRRSAYIKFGQQIGEQFTAIRRQVAAKPQFRTAADLIAGDNERVCAAFEKALPEKLSRADKVSPAKKPEAEKPAAPKQEQPAKAPAAKRPAKRSPKK